MLATATMPRSKEYGKLSESQFKQLLRSLPELKGANDKWTSLLRSMSAEKLDALIPDGVWWAPVYELTFNEALAWFVAATGLGAYLKGLIGSGDPQQAALQDIARGGPDLEWNGGYEGIFTKASVIALGTMLQRNIVSVMLHGRSLCSLVAEARDTGSDEALFNAVRIDPTVITGPTGATRLSRAELVGDRDFLRRLRGALKGPTARQWEAYRDLRFALWTLRELGFNQLSDAQLEHLLVKVLKVYPDVPAARKNLRQQYWQSKRIPSQ